MPRWPNFKQTRSIPANCLFNRLQRLLRRNNPCGIAFEATQRDNYSQCSVDCVLSMGEYFEQCMSRQSNSTQMLYAVHCSRPTLQFLVCCRILGLPACSRKLVAERILYTCKPRHLGCPLCTVIIFFLSSTCDQGHSHGAHLLLRASQNAAAP